LVGQIAFLVGGTLAEVFIHLRLGKRVFFLTQAQPGDPPERGQVHDAIAVGSTGRVAEHLFGQLATEGEQLAREAAPLDAGSREGEVEIGRHVVPQGAQMWLFLLGLAAATRLMPRLRLTRRAGMPVPRAVGRQVILDQECAAPEDLQAVCGLEYLHVLAARPGNPVVVGLEGHI